MFAPPSKGDRKFKHAQFMGLMLLAGLGFILLAHGDNALFATYTMGIGALSGAFVAGNVKEHALARSASEALAPFAPPGPRTPDTAPPFPATP